MQSASRGHLYVAASKHTEAGLMTHDRAVTPIVAPLTVLRRLEQRLEGLLLPGWRQAVAIISMLGFATVVGTSMVFLAQMLLARKLGPSSYGLFASSLATVTMIGPLAGFGLTQFRLKVYGVEGWAAHRWIKPSLQFMLVTTLLAAGTLVGWALLGAPDDSTRFMLLVLSPVILSMASVDLVANKLRLEDRFARMALWVSLAIPSSRLLVVLMLLLVPRLSVGFVAVGYGVIALGVALAALPHLIVLMRDEMRLTGHGPRPAVMPAASNPGMRDLWSQAWAFGVYAALYPIFFQISTILLKYLDGDTQSGMYSIGLAAMTAIYLIPTTIYQKFLLAKLHRWAAHDRPKFWLVYRRGNVGMLLLGLLVGGAVAVSAPWLVPMVFGEAYRGVVPVLLVLAFCPPIRFLSTAIGAALLTEHHMRFRVYAIAVATLVVVAVNALLIPSLAAVGAACATVCGELTLLLGSAYGVHRFHSNRFAEARGPVDDLITP
jgi:O-antigen/teichoic acid export membrane protein